MAKAKKISRAKARAVAIELHQLADAEGRRKRVTKITPEMTGTGSGVIRFRADRIIEAWRADFRKRRSAKLRASR
jgi:hypothetical protein